MTSKAQDYEAAAATLADDVDIKAADTKKGAVEQMKPGPLQIGSRDVAEMTGDGELQTFRVILNHKEALLLADWLTKNFVLGYEEPKAADPIADVGAVNA